MYVGSMLGYSFGRVVDNGGWAGKAQAQAQRWPGLECRYGHECADRYSQKQMAVDNSK